MGVRGLAKSTLALPFKDRGFWGVASMALWGCGFAGGMWPERVQGCLQKVVCFDIGLGPGVFLSGCVEI